MSRLGRIGLIILGAVIVLVALAAIGAAGVARRPFPKTDGSLTVAGLQGEVEVLRDAYGIPHIYASNEHDLFFAQGYIHAQDRFWQMDFSRHIGQGRLSELVGEATLDTDKFVRTLGWNRMATQTLAAADPEFVATLEAYSDGVNAYIEANRDTLSLNYTILGLSSGDITVEPWEPLDTISWGVVMAYQLSGNWSEELDRARITADIGEAAMENLVPGYPYDTRPVIAPTDIQTNDLPPSSHTPLPAGVVDWSRINTSLVGQPPGDLAFGSGPFVGSNNWVIGGDLTASGLPMLANDPHLGIQMPSIWYEAGLHGGSYDVVGFTFPGVPGVIIGHNQQIAWGVTNVGPDTQDLYIEKINPSNARQYEYQGQWQDMEVVTETILVANGEPVELEVLITRHGPIISDVVDDEKDVLAMRWTAQEPSTILSSVLMLDKAQDYDAFKDALAYWDIPSQNFVYADVAGNIAYQTPGRVPIRSQGDGQLPVPGWTGEYEWTGFIPYEEMPALFNPPAGFIVTANNAVVDPNYPYFIARDWSSGDRAQRITDMILAAGSDITAADIAAIQFDSHSLLAESYIPLFAGLSSDDPKVQAAIERLRGWDMQERRDSVPAAIFEIFFMQLAQNLLADDVGADNVDTVANAPFYHALATQPDATWWDDQTTPAKETREEILLASLADAITWLEENVGTRSDNWTWGSIHTATFVSDPLGQSGIAPIEAIVNRGPFPADGGRDLVNAASWSWSNPAAVRGHPSMRLIVDLSNLDASLAVIPTGQSGHPFNRHYDDMIQLWLDGEYHPLPYSRSAVEEATVDRLLLKPAGS